MTFIGSVQDFKDASAFERLTIDGLISAVDVEHVARGLDLRETPYDIPLGAEDAIGEPPRQELARNLRPLLFGAAWKVMIDLLIELGLNRIAGSSAPKECRIAD